MAALEIAANLSQFCTKLEKTQQDKQQWHNKVKGYCSVTIIRKQFKQKKGLVLNDDSGGTRGISLFNISDPEHLHEHVSQVAIWGKEQNAQKEKILRKIFKGQEDKAADLRNVRAHVHLHVQMHVRTKSSVRQSPFVLLVILILFYFSVFQTSFKNLLLLSFIHFLPWCIPSFHLPFNISTLLGCLFTLSAHSRAIILDHTRRENLNFPQKPGNLLLIFLHLRNRGLISIRERVRNPAEECLLCATGCVWADVFQLQMERSRDSLRGTRYLPSLHWHRAHTGEGELGGGAERRPAERGKSSWLPVWEVSEECVCVSEVEWSFCQQDTEDKQTNRQKEAVPQLGAKWRLSDAKRSSKLYWRGA